MNSGFTSSIGTLEWRDVKAVIFDVDGTLYTQAKLRRRMLFDLLGYYGMRPWRLREMLVLHHFRAEREKRAGSACTNLEQMQYVWCAQASGATVAEIRQLVERWMFRHPNQYLATCRYPGTQEFFSALRHHGIRIGIYSDYDAHDKLAALGLQADSIVSSTDPAVDHLKPAPQGLLHVCRQLGLTPAECLFIGDRPELDGLCAERAGMPHFIVSRQPNGEFNFYQDLIKSLDATLIPTPYESAVHVA